MTLIEIMIVVIIMVFSMMFIMIRCRSKASNLYIIK